MCYNFYSRGVYGYMVSNNNNNNKSNKVKIFVILLVLLIVLCGGFFIYRYFFYSTDFNIEVDDSKLYPNFDKSITEYVVYTDKDQIKINCYTSFGWANIWRWLFFN